VAENRAKKLCRKQSESYPVIKKWPLTAASFSSVLNQSRVISVLSYYLTSLVNLSFYSLFRRCPITPQIHSAAFFHQNFSFNTLVSENPLCRNLFSGLRLRLSAHVRSQLVSQHWDFFVPSVGILNIFIYRLLPTSASILLPATDERFRFVYLYIGITLSDYTVAYRNGFFNMENYIKHTKEGCTKCRNPW